METVTSSTPQRAAPTAPSAEWLQATIDSLGDGCIALDGSWRIAFMNRRAEEVVRALGGSPGGALGRDFWEQFPHLRGTPIEAAYREVMSLREPRHFEHYSQKLHTWLGIRAFPSPKGMTILFEDVGRRKEAEAMLELERAALAAIAAGHPLPHVLEVIAAGAEKLSVGGMLCSILLLDEAGERLLHGAAPSLDPAYNSAIHGLRIGPGVGSCGTAAYTGERVSVPDIASHPYWAAFAELARHHRLASCCSVPIRRRDGRVVGTIAMYHRVPKEPDPADSRLIESVVQTALLAIERDETRRALRSSDERLRATFEQAAVGITTADLTGRFVEMNQRFCDLVGYTREQLQRMTFRDLTHPEDLPGTLERVAMLRSGSAEEICQEKRYVRADGSVFWVLVRVRVMRRADGEPFRFIGVVEDIDAMKRAQEALERSEAFARGIVDSSGDCIKTVTREGVLTWISEHGCRVLCVSDPSEVVGRSYIELWQGDDREKAARAVAEAAEGRSASFVGHFPVAGQSRWWSVLVSPIRQGGAIERLLVTSRDITERVAAEEQLREEAALLELINESGSKLASNLDLEAVLQTVTDSATRLSGAEFGAFFYNRPGDEIGCYDLFVLSGAPRSAFEKLGHPRATPVFAPTFAGEGIVRSDDITADPRYGRMPPHHGMPMGHLPVRSYLAIPVRARSGEVIGGLFFGHSARGVFTERAERLVSAIAAQAAIAIDNARLYESARRLAREKEALLDSERHARTEAERASRMKDEFLATLSHELRTPLSAILGWSHVLKSKPAGSAEVAKGLDVIERNARLQTQLIEDLLDMSRITTGKLRLELQPVDPGDFVSSAIESVRPVAAAKGIHLEAAIDPETGPVNGDPARLQQVVWNLVNNAIKFTPRGGTVRVLLEPRDGEVQLQVIDDGAGIASEFLPCIFERFRQADASTTRKHGGLGLGLAIVKHLVEMHGGSVAVASEGPDRGSTFTVRLPMSAPGRHPVAAPGPGRDALPADLTGVRLVVVDDQPDAADLAMRVLQECGATVRVANGAAAALALIQQDPPDIVLSDIGMPDVDGYELVRRVRALPDPRAASVPAVAMTAFARSEDRVRALRAGFQSHIVKPVEPAELVAVVASLARRTAA